MIRLSGLATLAAQRPNHRKHCYEWDWAERSYFQRDLFATNEDVGGSHRVYPLSDGGVQDGRGDRGSTMGESHTCRARKTALHICNRWAECDASPDIAAVGSVSVRQTLCMSAWLLTCHPPSIVRRDSTESFFFLGCIHLVVGCVRFKAWTAG